MMQENHIVDTQLPLELDFKALKAEGLAYIQKHSSTAWTNLNPSDPGVTILEQLCYAFTELGYCVNFPMKDILTGKNGTLEFKDQFYTPTAILTTSPVTIEDYTKYVIDQVVSVKNVIINPIPTALPFVEGVYEVYIVLDTQFNNPTVTNSPISDTFYLLNTCRNLGELFLMPTVLVKNPYSITGDLELKSGYDFNKILPEIIQTINQYVFPDVIQTGYDTLRMEGESINEIFNGPILKNGWIPSESIQPKKDTIHTFEITKLIQGIKGVQSITKVGFQKDGESTSPACCGESEILVFNFLQTSTDLNQLQVHTQGKHLNSDFNTDLITELGNMQQVSAQINNVAAVAMEPALPEGSFRDITSYYSIQNTFPEAYKIGLNAVNQNSPDFQVAQSRQLKGYLNLFDQMLSNQFAQLANIDKLFSFKNSTTGNPADLENYLNTKTKEQQAHPEYPAPFEVFSPTYFYQSLYESVPNVEPLLRNNTIFNFGPTSQSETALAHKSWLSYQEDPYNSYMYGLLVSIEDDTVNLQRRNDLLDHLLARHGESPLIIDTIIYGTIYSGDVLKDRVIIKSLYLQNLGVLSYNRTKAYTITGATKITKALPRSTEKSLQKLQQQNTNDAIFNSTKVDKEQIITQQDTIDYSGIELKLSLLLGVHQCYTNYISNEEEKNFEYYYKKGFYLSSYFLTYHKKNLAMWMITERKGLISIETNILLQSGSFEVFIKEENDSTNTYYKYTNTTLTYTDFITLTTSFNTLTNDEVQTLLTSENTAWTQEIDATNVANDTFDTIRNTEYSWTAHITWGNEFETTIHNPIFDNMLLLFFPDFIPDLNTKDCKQRLSYFLDSQLPLHISAISYYLNSTDICMLISLFSDWHNALLYNGTTENFDTVLATTNAGKLLTNLDQFYKKLANV